MRPSSAERPLIIDRPDLQTRAQRYGYLSVTFLCWFLWLYLFVPLLSLVAWALGATLVYQVMIADLHFGELLALLRVYGLGIAALTAVYLTWAVSSYLRFRNVERRHPPGDTDMNELAASHRLSRAELETLRHTGRTVLSADLMQRMFGAVPESGEEDRVDVTELPRQAEGSN